MLLYLAEVTMTTRSVNALRDTFRKTIRKEQLEQMFRHERMLLMHIRPQEAVQMIEGQLEGLWEALSQKNKGEIVNCLVYLRNIAGQFMVIHFLMRQVRISTLQNMHKCLPITWIEAFLALLSEDEETIREESSALFSTSLFQIRLSNYPQYQLKKRIIIQQFPIKFLNDPNWKVSYHMLDAFQEMLQSTQFQRQVVYLINNQHFLMVFVSLLEEEDKMQIKGYQEKVVETSLLLIYFIYQTEIVNERPQIQLLHSLVKSSLIYRMEKGDHSSKLFTMIRALSISQVQFSIQEIGQIEKQFYFSLDKQNTSYFQMFNALIYQHSYIISHNSFEILTQKLFKYPDSQDPGFECLRKWLALVFHKTLQLIGQQYDQQGYMIILSNLLANLVQIDHLQLIMDTSRQQNEALFTTLLQSLYNICQILDSSQQTMALLAFLQRYDEDAPSPIP